MRSLSDTIRRLSHMRSPLDLTHGRASNSRLSELKDFGANPGDLRAACYLPTNLPENAPLIVVLHGCTQTAADYDQGAGWSHMADRHGFALLFPEQKAQNNPNRCFNWFSPDDTRHGGGEVLSIRQMIEAMTLRHGLDRKRIFVTGLSAGGAMASALLATCPDLFAGGAIIAGLPYGCANNVTQALDRMRGHGLPDEAALASKLRRASSHKGSWPVISVWHGSADITVHPSNGTAIVDQWRGVHGLGREPTRKDIVGGHSRLVWTDRDGRDCIEHYSINAMGHGAPLATGDTACCGSAGPFMLEAGISSTWHICHFWKLIQAPETWNSDPSAQENLRDNTEGTPSLAALSAAPPASSADVGKVIEDALRAAGLMR